MSIAYTRTHESRPGPHVHRRDRRRRASHPRIGRAVRRDDAQRRGGRRRPGPIALQASPRSCRARARRRRGRRGRPVPNARARHGDRRSEGGPAHASPSNTAPSSGATRMATGCCSQTCRPVPTRIRPRSPCWGRPSSMRWRAWRASRWRSKGARTMVAWAHGFVTMELAGAFRLGGDIDAAYAFGIESILAGVSASASPASR